MHTVRPLYTNGDRRSAILRDLIDEEITINPNFVRNKLIFGNGGKRHGHAVAEHETPFQEIRVVPYENAFESHEEAVNFEGQGIRDSVDGKAYLEAFEQVVDASWDSTKFNLVYHSSGYDSRLISHFIRRKYESQPGHVLFVCWGSECEAFENIMKYEGWDESQYVTCPLEMEMSMYAFSFADVWKHVNGGSMHFPASMFHTVLDYLRAIGKVPADTLNIWTGLDNNNMINWEGTLDSNYKRCYYAWGLRIWGVIGGRDTIQPGMDIKVGKVLFAAASRKDKMRYELVRLADPKLAALPRCKTSRQEVPVDALEKMVTDFKHSYYYQNIDQVPDPAFETPILMHDGRHRKNHIFWRKWTAASLVDELVRKGICIRTQ